LIHENNKKSATVAAPKSIKCFIFSYLPTGIFMDLETDTPRGVK